MEPDIVMTAELREALTEVIGNLKASLAAAGEGDVLLLPERPFLAASVCALPPPLSEWREYTLQRDERQEIEQIVNDLEDMMTVAPGERIMLERGFIARSICG